MILSTIIIITITIIIVKIIIITIIIVIIIKILIGHSAILFSRPPNPEVCWSGRS